MRKYLQCFLSALFQWISFSISCFTMPRIFLSHGVYVCAFFIGDCLEPCVTLYLHNQCCELIIILIAEEMLHNINS